MKIKTVIFWALWVGNNITLQTVSGDQLGLEAPSPPSLTGWIDDLVLLCQKRAAIASPDDATQPAIALTDRLA
jgi:hypothetical protein